MGNCGTDIPKRFQIVGKCICDDGKGQSEESEAAALWPIAQLQLDFFFQLRLISLSVIIFEVLFSLEQMTIQERRPNLNAPLPKYHL